MAKPKVQNVGGKNYIYKSVGNTGVYVEADDKGREIPGGEILNMQEYSAKKGQAEMDQGELANFNSLIENAENDEQKQAYKDELDRRAAEVHNTNVLDEGTVGAGDIQHANKYSSNKAKAVDAARSLLAGDVNQTIKVSQNKEADKTMKEKIAEEQKDKEREQKTDEFYTRMTGNPSELSPVYNLTPEEEALNKVTEEQMENVHEGQKNISEGNLKNIEEGLTGDELTIANADTKEQVERDLGDAKAAEEAVNNGNASQVVKSKDTPEEIRRPARNIWTAWLNGEFGDKDSDGAKKERNYLILDAIGTFAKNAGRQLGNVGAQFTGGTIDNTQDESAWQQRQNAINRNEAQAAAETNINSPAGRQKQRELLNMEAQRYMNDKSKSANDLLNDWNQKANDPTLDFMQRMYYRELVTKLATSGMSMLQPATDAIGALSSIVGGLVK